MVTQLRLLIISGLFLTLGIQEVCAFSKPHGGTLIDRFVSSQEFEDLLSRAKAEYDVTEKTRNDIECIAAGIYSPLKGFMNRADYLSVITSMRLADGAVWPVPVVLDIPNSLVKDLSAGDFVALKYNGVPIAVVRVEDLFQYNKKLEEKKVFGTTSKEHPGVRVIEDQHKTYVGGNIFVQQGAFDNDQFAESKFYPKDVREVFQKKGWDTVVAFQTRNPLHRAHEHLLKTALESKDGLLLNPLVGSTKSDDVPPDVRMKTYKVMLNTYFNPERVVLSTFPAAMRYAGPKEAILHAIARQNYGCTHMIIGRDHAGVGNFYGPFDAQNIFKTLAPEDLEIQIMTFENAFFCKSTGQMATSKTCPANSETVKLSGTKVRELLKQGIPLPEELTRPEVAEILAAYYNNNGDKNG